MSSDYRANQDLRQIADTNIAVLQSAYVACELIRSAGHPATVREYRRRVNYEATQLMRRLGPLWGMREARRVVRNGRKQALRSWQGLQQHGPDEAIRLKTSVTLLSVQSHITALGKVYDLHLNVDLMPILRAFNAGETTCDEAFRSANDAHRPYGSGGFGGGTWG